MTLFVVAAIAFLGVSLVGFGLFGRPDQSRPTCRACNADARPAAWDSPPVCVCGARLDRAGAVRTRGRIRRPRAAIVGVIVVIIAAGVAGLSRWLRETNRSWWDVVPMAIVQEGLRHQWEWAHRTVQARRARGELDDATLADALLTAMNVGPPIETAHQEFIDLVRSEWITKPFEADRLVSTVLGFDIRIDRAKATEGAAPDGSFVLTAILTGAPASSGGAWFFRLDRIAVDSIEVPFDAEVLRGRRSRILVAGSPGATFALPPRVPATSTDVLVVVEGYLVSSRVGLAAVGDPLIDSTAGPDTWEIDAIVLPVRREIRVSKTDPDRAEATTGVDP